jgi:hypothetical protein
MDNEIRICSFGGGVQSTAILVMQAMGMLKKNFHQFVFANVGNDSENPGTLQYIEEITKPFAEANLIPLVTVQKAFDGKPDSIYRLIYRTPRSQPLPMYKSGGTPDGHSCSVEFKAKQIDKYCRDNNWERVTVGLGISIDEFTRAKKETWHNTYGKMKLGFEKRFYQPLIHAQIDRYHCLDIIREAGLPTPPRSACWFCPVAKPSEWIEMKRNNPELFWKACQLEDHINKKRGATYPSDKYVSLHRYKTPLLQAVADQQLLPGFENENEYCGGMCGI